MDMLDSLANLSGSGTLPNEKFKFFSTADPFGLKEAVNSLWSQADPGIIDGYHLFGAYLIENTRIVQIFEKLLEMFLTDEELGIPDDPAVPAWIFNTEYLFYSEGALNVSFRSAIRPNAEATRRNAYWRMFGVDVSFGSGSSSRPVAYPKAQTANVEFVPLVERYLQAASRNDASLPQMVKQLKDCLVARRGDFQRLSYHQRNLSREEFDSMLLTSWFAFIVSYNSPLVSFLKCGAATAGERLTSIGNKVGLQAHSKSEAFLNLAQPASRMLQAIESDKPVDTQELLSIINNWEKATGHSIHNP